MLLLVPPHDQVSLQLVHDTLTAGLLSIQLVDLGRPLVAPGVQKVLHGHGDGLLTGRELLVKGELDGVRGELVDDALVGVGRAGGGVDVLGRGLAQ